MTRVELQIAPPSAQGALANMLQLYIHDFSEHWPDDRWELSEDGRFGGGPDLSRLWRDPDFVPLLIRAEGRLAGFCVLDRRHHGARPVDRNMAEFFVVRKHRRQGVGAAAAQAAFSSYPGTWEVAVRASNAGGLAFWPRVIAAHPAVMELHQLAEPADWDGPVYRFSVT